MVQHVYWGSGNFFSYIQFHFGNIVWTMSINFVPPKEKFQGDKSGCLAVQEVSLEWMQLGNN
jgi:hypothetical protein